MSEADDTFDPYNPANLPDRTEERRAEKKAIQAGDVNNLAASKLRSYIERVERLEEEKASVSDDIKNVYGEAKGDGFDPRRCASSCGCARKTRPSGPNARRYWIRILPHSA